MKEPLLRPGLCFCCYRRARGVGWLLMPSHSIRYSRSTVSERSLCATGPPGSVALGHCAIFRVSTCTATGGESKADRRQRLRTATASLDSRAGRCNEGHHGARPWPGFPKKAGAAVQAPTAKGRPVLAASVRPHRSAVGARVGGSTYCPGARASTPCVPCRPLPGRW